MDDGRLHERVDALERAVTDGHAADGLPDAASLEARVADLEATVDDIGDRVAELDAAVQALRGFAGGIRAVDESVEQRANAAIARVERLEAELQKTAEAPTDDGRVERDGAAADDRRDGGAKRHSTAPDPHDGEGAETRVAPTDGERATAPDSDHDATATTSRGPVEHDAVVTEPSHDRDETLHGTVTARSDAALAAAAARGGQSGDGPGEDETEDRSLADRLRRLL